MSHPRERGRGRDGGRDGREKTCDWARGRRGTRGSVEKRRAGRFGASTRAHLEGDAGVGGDGEDRDEGGCGMDDGGWSPVSVAIVAGRRGYRRRFAGMTPPARQAVPRYRYRRECTKAKTSRRDTPEVFAKLRTEARSDLLVRRRGAVSASGVDMLHLARRGKGNAPRRTPPPRMHLRGGYDKKDATRRGTVMRLLVH